MKNTKQKNKKKAEKNEKYEITKRGDMKQGNM